MACFSHTTYPFTHTNTQPFYSHYTANLVLADRYHPQIRTGGFCWSKFTAHMSCWWELALLLQLLPFYGSLDFVGGYPGKPAPER